MHSRSNHAISPRRFRSGLIRITTFYACTKATPASRLPAPPAGGRRQAGARSTDSQRSRACSPAARLCSRLVTLTLSSSGTIRSFEGEGNFPQEVGGEDLSPLLQQIVDIFLHERKLRARLVPPKHIRHRAQPLGRRRGQTLASKRASVPYTWRAHPPRRGSSARISWVVNEVAEVRVLQEVKT